MRIINVYSNHISGCSVTLNSKSVVCILWDKADEYLAKLEVEENKYKRLL